MVDLDQLVCKDCYAFEKGKVYCVKMKVPKDHPREFIGIHAMSLVETFNKKGIEAIVIPEIEGELEFEFFKCNDEFNFNSEENGGE